MRGSLQMMLAFLLGLLFVGLTSSTPTSNDDNSVVIEDVSSSKSKVYEGQHDIVKIYVPINKLNFKEDKDDVLLFFVEADVNGDEVVDQGLYVKKGKAVTKLLDHGRDVAAPHDEYSSDAFFAAKDGLYIYDHKENKAVKYGTINDDLIGITIGHSADEMFVLSADKKVYKISDNGNKKVLWIDNVEQIMLDNNSTNLYYIDTEKNLKVVRGVKSKYINSLFMYPKITLIRPPFIYDEGIFVLLTNKLYVLYPNDILSNVGITIDTDVSAYAPDATLIQFYGRKKKIYQYNISPLVLGTVAEQLRDFHDELKQNTPISARHSNQFILETNI